MLIPDPGPLPRLPSPIAGESIRVQVAGFPPDKDIHFSIRNPRHRRHQRFIDLRLAAIEAMAGRARYLGPIELKMKIRAPEMNRSLWDYAGGVMDTLDGSHGPSFTYLPIAYQDDCQVAVLQISYESAVEPTYELEIILLDAERESQRVMKSLQTGSQV